MAGTSQQDGQQTDQEESNMQLQFKMFATKANGYEATTKDITRWMTDAGVFKGAKLCTSQNLDIAFSAVKPRGKFTITVEDMAVLIERISVQYGKDHKMSQGEAAQTLTNILSCSKKVGHGKIMTSITGGVEKMTDTSQYTGSHKERFDESGKGKGMDGRLHQDKNFDSSGYVGSYGGHGGGAGGGGGAYYDYTAPSPYNPNTSAQKTPGQLDTGQAVEVHKHEHTFENLSPGGGGGGQSQHGGNAADPHNFLNQSGYVSGYKEAGSYDTRQQQKAPTGKIDSTVEGQFKSYASIAQGAEATTRDVIQWMTDAGVFKGSHTCSIQNLDHAIAEIKPVGKTTITAREIGALINHIAVQYSQDHAMTQKNAVTTLRAMLEATNKDAPGMKSKPAKSTAASITDRLTDSSLYTGAHKDRFDASGQGRGMAGRTDRDDRAGATGYVGNYKGAGTYGS